MSIQIREDKGSRILAGVKVERNYWLFVDGNKAARFDAYYAKDNEYLIREIILREGIDFFDTEDA